MSNEDRIPTALLVTSDQASRAGLAAVLSLSGWRVQDVPTATMGMQALRGVLPDVLVLDHRLPDDDGVGLMRSVRHLPGNERLVVGVLVDQVDRATAVAYVKAGVGLFFAKPLDLADAAQRLAERVPGAAALSPPVESRDPLARPLVVVASPSLNTRDTAFRAVGEEVDLLHFDGFHGLEPERRRAAALVVDDGLAGGLEAVSGLQALFGPAPALALTARGAEDRPGFAAVLTKPLREGALRRHVRLLLDREWLAAHPMSNGLVLRLRDGWQGLDPAAFARLAEQVRALAASTRGSGRRWLCLDGPYLGAPEHTDIARRLLDVARRDGLHVGAVTPLPDLVRVAHALRLHPALVHNSSASFIKVAQGLV